ncbi:hypothetical protein L484_020716 [Morus notabilis]|uniref:Uncharacterized protein n=1 Tax=Morus notabilis TaxID=981085 RepID=W9R8F6_9ROSA|nr:hypothetical protein L484_020716 [Morus notabilis]
MAAHTLAKLSLSSIEDQFWLEDYPSCIDAIVITCLILVRFLKFSPNGSLRQGPIELIYSPYPYPAQLALWPTT